MRDLNLQQLCKDKFGDNADWKKLGAGEQAEIIRRALQCRTFIIDPMSSYMKGWDVVLVACLVFTALVTPFEISFLKPKIDWLYVVNRVVDFVFVKDMVMQFFMKVQKHTRQGTVWVRDRRRIAKMYIQAWFFIDLLAIIPYDELTNLLGNGDDDLNKLKVLRLLRVLRLFKLARILKASRVIKRWQNRIALSSTSVYLG
ncbi:unnamed protein product, partial [Polarella glacialis]